MDVTTAISRLRIGLLAAISTATAACNADGVRDSCATASSEVAVYEDYVCYDPASASGSSTALEETMTDGTTLTTTDSTSNGTGSTSNGTRSTSDGTRSTSSGTGSSTSGETGLPDAAAAETGGGGLCSAFTSGPLDYYDDWSGPVEERGQCCFAVKSYGLDVCGRPLVVDGRMRTAESVRRSDWRGTGGPSLENIDAATRDALADAWRADAAAEHASVASFARFALQLMAVGAPAELLVETQRAMADEIEHARLCYTLASGYAGRDLGPDRLPLEGVLSPTIDLAALAVSTIHEGCRGEALAALQAQIASTRATDPAVRDVLRRIAADEARHAALAWRFVAWALRRGDPSVFEAVEKAFSTAPPVMAPTRRIDAPDLSRHGRLSATELASLPERAEAELVRPLAHRLLHTIVTPRRSVTASPT